MNANGLADIKAITFDVQGTCVDFYQPILRAGAAINETKGLDIDWAALSTEWRELYRASMNAVIAGHRGWLRVDRIYREALDKLVETRSLSDRLDDAERDELNNVWTRLDAWPDVVEGLTRLRRHYLTSTLSNAGMASVIALVRNAGLPFDAVLTAELARSYKPAPAVYQLAVDYLGYRPDQILMVACHKYDLKAARAFGMKTAFVPRALEFGPEAAPDISPESWFDVYATSFIDLAEQLQAV
ncbi:MULTISPECIES: haloacid dehalogenase type II [Bradyrhizobium]|uniref:Haloacid dehalogenase n=1 Tax=Bradyrhizobium nanningense TaxID=1325118 RepID=A0A4Q0RWN2_9BRAD|nr:MULTISPECIES: haloacid dehalogenase type II [Bradyrhizobium]RXH23729.1 haloacid dehalogenase [Bradyrhizobium nanningense]RXH31212.1 haloacid dehalogenase [Bradyrhizobium nanningense]TQF33866.1 haloacid dehalogenase [Bradyrhizobium sp. UNPA324]